VRNLKKINLINHELVPKHLILSEKEGKELFEKYGISIKHLPRILESDPVIKAIGGNIGDIIKIIRKSSTAGESVYYRVVVKG